MSIELHPQSFIHMLSVMNELESALGIHYEISSGSALGTIHK